MNKKLLFFGIFAFVGLQAVTLKIDYKDQSSLLELDENGYGFIERDGNRLEFQSETNQGEPATLHCTVIVAGETHAEGDIVVSSEHPVMVGCSGEADVNPIVISIAAN